MDNPRYAHISQLENWGDGWGLQGHNNCAEASICRYLREADYPFDGNDTQLIAWLRVTITGVAEQEGEGYTTTQQITDFFARLGIDGSWTNNLSRALGGWRLLLVRAGRLSPAQYPYAWINNDAVNHYILSLPNGSYNDPLAWFNGQKDAAYSSMSVLAALEGGFVNILPNPHALGWNETTGKAHVLPAVRPAPQHPILHPKQSHGPEFRVKVAMELRPLPQLWPTSTILVKEGTVVKATGRQTPHFAQVVVGAEKGWLWIENLASA